MWYRVQCVSIVKLLAYFSDPCLAWHRMELQALCAGTRHFDRDQGQKQKYDGIGTKAGERNMTGPGPVLVD